MKWGSPFLSTQYHAEDSNTTYCFWKTLSNSNVGLYKVIWCLLFSSENLIVSSAVLSNYSISSLDFNFWKDHRLTRIIRYVWFLYLNKKDVMDTLHIAPSDDSGRYVFLMSMPGTQGELICSMHTTSKRRFLEVSLNGSKIGKSFGFIIGRVSLFILGWAWRVTRRLAASKLWVVGLVVGLRHLFDNIRQNVLMQQSR